MSVVVVRRYLAYAAVAGTLLLASACQKSLGAPPSTPRYPDLFERVCVLGASLSAGFGVGTPFDRPFQAALPPTSSARTLADPFFFQDPWRAGQRLVDGAIAADPTFVVALDFLFWFGYGHVFPSVDETPAEERLSRLEHGLRLLERIDVPLVVADFPDMSSAVGKMLQPGQVPEAPTLRRLNDALAAWAAARAAAGHPVLVLALDEMREALRSGAPFRMGRTDFPAGTRLLLPDELHPDAEGQAAVALWVLDAVVGAGWGDEAAVLFDHEAVLDGL